MCKSSSSIIKHFTRRQAGSIQMETALERGVFICVSTFRGGYVKSISRAVKGIVADASDRFRERRAFERRAALKRGITDHLDALRRFDFGKLCAVGKG